MLLILMFSGFALLAIPSVVRFGAPILWLVGITYVIIMGILFWAWLHTSSDGPGSSGRTTADVRQMIKYRWLVLALLVFLLVVGSAYAVGRLASGSFPG
ncbi:hypothetical protein DSY14_18735 [Nocardiopsis sp. MG754419]|nr:hypothetical protein [Nocardiopsis sp. MG754419]